MTLPERPLIERRLLAAIDSSPSRIPVLLGGCGAGRTTLMMRLRELVGHSSAQYVDLEAIATTPERCADAIKAASPFPPAGSAQPPADPKQAFDRLLGHFDGSRAPGHEPATFLLDEFLEFRTFENFPGLRHVVRDFIARVGESRNRFVLSSRYSARTLRVLRDAPARFEVIQLPPLTASEALASCADGSPRWLGRDGEETAMAVHALSAGRATHAGALTRALRTLGATDPISALVALMAPGGEIAARCRQSYELRLHRARGYGALKAILSVLAEEEGLTLTEIAQRLHRTPGSTKDYLSWLEDVDLVVSTRKRYAFEDPVLRLFVRLYAQPSPPSDEDVARQVHEYAMRRLPAAAAPEPELAALATGTDDRSWGIIEID
ncbi:MAG: winged helix-turn-helix domain-containing protein [Acidobacteriota bacterium]|nr:winged helix-turn-helix domain-containing protein [Acidobacteriota bacterium]